MTCYIFLRVYVLVNSDSNVLNFPLKCVFAIRLSFKDASNIQETAIYNVIDYCSQTQAVYDHLWNCSYPINELLHSFLDLFTGVKKYVVYY